MASGDRNCDGQADFNIEVTTTHGLDLLDGEYAGPAPVA